MSDRHHPNFVEHNKRGTFLMLEVPFLIVLKFKQVVECFVVC